MPKSIIVSNALLLLSLSALAGMGLPVLLGDASSYATYAGMVWVFATTALVTGFVMVLTELFSGHRYIALVAFAGVAVGATSTWRRGVDPEVIEWAWIVGLLAVILWFTILASAGRSNR